MTYLALMQILGPETCKQMIREQDVAQWEQQEASEGIVAEPYLGNVCKEDQPDPTSWELGTPDPLAQLGDDAE